MPRGLRVPDPVGLSNYRHGKRRTAKTEPRALYPALRLTLGMLAEPTASDEPQAIVPCAACRHFDRCTAGRLACEAFALFVRFRDHPFGGPARYALSLRQPSRAILERLLKPRR